MTNEVENKINTLENPNTRLFNDENRIESNSKSRKSCVLEKHGYTVGRIIGTGSYATVKIAHSKRHGYNVAVKIVSKMRYTSDNLEKFLPREIEVVKYLRHENLINYYETIETTHRVYIIMEYAENGSLFSFIQKDNHVDESRARKWFKELVNAVEYCHKNGIVHRTLVEGPIPKTLTKDNGEIKNTERDSLKDLMDNFLGILNKNLMGRFPAESGDLLFYLEKDLKCENLLLDANYSIKLSDFGFARDNMIQQDGKIKISSTFCGSYAYASPEILNGIPYQPNASDIWSMGVILYAMIFRNLPFDDTNIQLLIKQQTKVTFPQDEPITDACKQMITKLLAPLRIRLNISEIKKEPWYLA